MSTRSNNRLNFRVIISEIIMVTAVIATVTVLAFVVSGYWINSDLEVERQGMLQISSSPTGANVNIDGESSSWLQRTNTSKVIPSGEHTVTLTKSGYDSWSKTINIQEGLLYRLYYPRLFLTDRTATKALDTTGITNAFFSPDRSTAVITNATTKWQYLDLRSDSITPHTLDISNIFTIDANETNLFTGNILIAKWDHDSAHLLLQIQTDSLTEWVLLDVKSPSRSLNLTKEFGQSFDAVEILDNSSTHLLATKSGNLHHIDVPSRSISRVLAEQVSYFDHFENDIIFAATTESNPHPEDETSPTSPYYIGLIKGNTTTNLLYTTTPAKVVLSQFYDNKYFTVLLDNQVTIYTLNDLSEFAKFDLSFTPNTIKVGHNGEFIVMSTDSQLATIDMEANALREWTIESDTFGWLDYNMIYTVDHGELIVYDFDGLNRRPLAQNVSDHLPAGITEDKWLYYFSDDRLLREWIIEH